MRCAGGSTIRKSLEPSLGLEPCSVSMLVLFSSLFITNPKMSYPMGLPLHRCSTALGPRSASSLILSLWTPFLWLEQKVVQGLSCSAPLFFSLKVLRICNLRKLRFLSPITTGHASSEPKSSSSPFSRSRGLKRSPPNSQAQEFSQPTSFNLTVARPRDPWLFPSRDTEGPGLNFAREITII